MFSFLKLRDTSPQGLVLGMLKRIIHSKCIEACHGGEIGGLDSLQQLALWLTASTKGVDTVLCGARSLKYVKDLEIVSAVQRLEEQEVWAVFDEIQQGIDEIK